MNRAVKRILLDVVLLDGEQMPAPSLSDMARRAKAILDEPRAARSRRQAKSKPRREWQMERRQSEDAAWRIIQREAMVRSAGRCEVCGGIGAVAHHLLSGADRHADSVADVAWVCSPCHRDLHRNDAVAFGRLLSLDWLSPAAWAATKRRLDKVSR